VTSNGHSGFGTDANTLALIGDTLYVGGDFNQAGTVAANHFAGYNIGAGEWSAPGNSVGGFDDSIIYALAPFGTDLFVGGHFTSAGAAQARFVARFDTLTAQWSALGSGLRWYNDRFTEVTSLTASEDGVYVGGSFDAAGGRAASGFARWAGPLAAGDVTNEQGGAVAGPGGLQIQFPAGAAIDDLVVRLTELAGPGQNLPAGVGGVRHFYAAATTMSGQAVTHLLKPYTLRVPYSEAQLAAAGVTDPATLNLLTWDGAAWQTLLPCPGCGVDTANKTVTLVAGHFSEFALVGALAESNPGTQQQIFLPLVQK
jgi:hypothetical protein